MGSSPSGPIDGPRLQESRPLHRQELVDRLRTLVAVGAFLPLEMNVCLNGMQGGSNTTWSDLSDAATDASLLLTVNSEDGRRWQVRVPISAISVSEVPSE
jgi:hypothetical protein